MYQRLLNNSFIYLLVSVLQAGVQLVLLPIHTHFLPPADYGIIAMVLASSGLMNVLFNLGLHGAAQRFCADQQIGSKTEQHVISQLSLLVKISCLTMAASTGVFFYLSYYLCNFNNPDLLYLGFAVVHSAGMGMMLVADSCLRIQQRVKAFSITFGTMYLNYLILNLILLPLLHGSFKAVLIAHAAMPWFGLLFLKITRKQVTFAQPDFFLLKQLSSYGLKLLPHFIFSVLLTVADRFFLHALLGKAATGRYQAAAMVATLMAMFVAALGVAARPYIFNNFRQATQAAFTSSRQLAILLSVIIGVVGLNLALWAPDALHYLTAPAYWSMWPVSLLLIARHMLFGLAMLLICSLLFNKNKAYYVSIASGISVILLFSIVTPCAKYYGVYGVASAMLITLGFYILLLYLLGLKACAMRWPLLKMLGIVAGAFLIALVLIKLINQMQLSVLELGVIKIFVSSSCFVVMWLNKSRFALPNAKNYLET